MSASSDSKSSGSDKQNQNDKQSSKGLVTDEEDYGYYFYPEREGKKQKSYFERVLSRDDASNFKCRMNVQLCMERNPMVKLMVGALSSHGCPVDVKRHISCEPCLDKVSGGFDPKTMQLCVKNKALQSVLLVRNVTKEQGMIAVDEVFDRCYRDTEPYGRRCFKSMPRAKRAMDEARNYYDFD
ncbi:mitochondrial inner membrane protease atp23-like protein [Elysia marginata]|uniref:Mitochondrial inner membrane protease ATP23 n=1 Tax=Elysia marginata TaxID=1093978 RepID=A0AAV4EYP4_9GAST|nr:mitochondrial inner membrane protease atp23-like protein [Elysia marginata]